ncbi:MAG: transposase [Oscillospiraceae bacterium]|jgi:REP element-mobilizing transposase RayT|nr:transposase [Oscillospiraceae bacterium]
METYEQEFAMLEVYDKLAQSRAEVESGQPLIPLNEAFAKYRAKYVEHRRNSENAVTPYNPDIHHRRSIRLKEYVYSQSGAYYVTVCTRNRECLFGAIVDGQMKLNEPGNTVKSTLNGLSSHYPNVKLDEYVIMPNHVHCIFVLTDVGAGFKPALPDENIEYESIAASVEPELRGTRAGLKPAPTTGLSEIVRALKTFSARRINEQNNTQGMPLWQRNYYEHIIRSDDEYRHVVEYIINNPMNWEKDTLWSKMPP